MRPDQEDGGRDGNEDGAAKREAERSAARNLRLAEALRSNLRRRKDQARKRQGPEAGNHGEHGSQPRTADPSVDTAESED